MPQIRSAKKALRQSLKRHARNLNAKRRVKENIKEIALLIKAGKKTEAAKKLPEIFGLIDKAAKKHVFHDNKAARKKSQLAKMVA